MAEYCNDHFKMVEDTDDSFRMWQGLVGPCYTPVLSNDGTLSWTNNGNLPNPEAVNIRGPQGAGIRIAGIVDSVESLPASAADGAIWLVGEGSPYEGYAWISSGWIDLGPLTVGPAGPPGPQGDDYELTEADKQEIAEISESILLTELDSEPLGVRYGGTGARTVEGAKQMLGIDEITDKLGTWPLGTDAQDVAGAINEMIGEIDLQVADIEQLKNNFAGEFSPTSTYTVGTYVVYDGAFWRCTTAVTTAGSWTGASNWTQVTAGGELKTANTNISTLASDISDLNTALSGKASKSGDNITNPGTWRSALGLCYAANDTLSINSSAVISGFINNNSNTFWLEWSVDKSMENISTVTVTTMSGYAMGVNGGLDGSTSTKDYTASPYSISVAKQGNYYIRIGVSKSSAFTNTTPLSPVTYFGTLALKFT